MRALVRARLIRLVPLMWIGIALGSIVGGALAIMLAWAAQRFIDDPLQRWLAGARRGRVGPLAIDGVTA